MILVIPGRHKVKGGAILDHYEGQNVTLNRLLSPTPNCVRSQVNLTCKSQGEFVKEELFLGRDVNLCSIKVKGPLSECLSGIQ